MQFTLNKKIVGIDIIMIPAGEVLLIYIHYLINGISLSHSLTSNIRSHQAVSQITNLMRTENHLQSYGTNSDEKKCCIYIITMCNLFF